MALHHIHYLVTAFGLTVWTHAPGLILALVYAFQAIMYIADIDVPDYDDYIFWQFLTSLGGVLVGASLLLVTRAPRMLQFQVSYVGVWGQFILWLVFYLAAQLFYGFFPPPTYPWGVIGISVTHLIIQVPGPPLVLPRRVPNRAPPLGHPVGRHVLQRLRVWSVPSLQVLLWPLDTRLAGHGSRLLPRLCLARSLDRIDRCWDRSCHPRGCGFAFPRQGTVLQRKHSVRGATHWPDTAPRSWRQGGRGLLMMDRPLGGTLNPSMDTSVAPNGSSDGGNEISLDSKNSQGKIFFNFFSPGASTTPDPGHGVWDTVKKS